MIKKQSLLSTVLVMGLALMLLLTACGNSDSQATTDSPTSSPQSTMQQDTTEQNNTISITDEPITFEVWYSVDLSQSGLKSLNEDPAFQELEKRTGVHIEWQSPSVAQKQDQFNLMIASGDYADMIVTEFTQYQGGNDKAVNDGVFLRLNDLVDQYAPNYKKIRESDEEIFKNTMTDEGNLVFFSVVTEAHEPPFFGPLVRQDWLDSLDLETPETLDDWYVMLKAFKDQKNASAPLYFNKFGLEQGLMSAFGISNGIVGSLDFVVVDGTVKYSGLEPGLKEYLELANKWYSEGLIDKDYYARNAGYSPDLTQIVKGQTGAVVYTHGSMDIMTPQMEDKNAVWTSVPYPTKTAGEKVHLMGITPSKVVGSGLAITTACEEPEIAVKWADYLYTEEGSMLMDYGISGVSYNMVDGKPEYTDVILQNPDGLSANVARDTYTAPSDFPRVYDWSRVYAVTSPAVSEAGPIWQSNIDFAWSMPAITATPEEGAEFSKIMGDINTYTSEMVNKFILGSEPLSKYDEFISTINSMDIDRAIAIQQDALNRYNERK